MLCDNNIMLLIDDYLELLPLSNDVKLILMRFSALRRQSLHNFDEICSVHEAYDKTLKPGGFRSANVFNNFSVNVISLTFLFISKFYFDVLILNFLICT